ncbi:hypothetical protein B0O80DRAFT_499898 [Mortierella sp. GBAus27b]|nr:hypothetical protein B0O80DRAFT_499898 [Mortierella sp. GBAus27b]
MSCFLEVSDGSSLKEIRSILSDGEGKVLSIDRIYRTHELRNEWPPTSSFFFTFIHRSHYKTLDRSPISLIELTGAYFDLVLRIHGDALVASSVAGFDNVDDECSICNRSISITKDELIMTQRTTSGFIPKEDLQEIDAYHTIEIHPEHPPMNDESQAHGLCHRILRRFHIQHLRTALLSMLDCTRALTSAALKHASKEADDHPTWPPMRSRLLSTANTYPTRLIFIDSTQNTSAACITTVVGSFLLNTVPGTIDGERKT